MKKRTIMLAFLVCCFSIQGICGDADDYVNEYLSHLEKNKTAVFFTKCKSKKDSRNIVTLLLPALCDSIEGLLIEEQEGFVVNTARVIITSNGLKMEETNGGVYSYDRVTRLVKELSVKRFLLLAPFSIDN